MKLCESRNIADSIISQMKPDQRQKYVELMRQSEALNGELEKLQEEAAVIATKRKQLEEEVALSQVENLHFLENSFEIRFFARNQFSYVVSLIEF